MRIPNIKRGTNGTSLVEVIVSVAILATTSLAVIGCIIYGYYAMRSVRENQRATQIMLEKLETIRLFSWSEVTSNGFIPPTFSDVYDPQTTNGPGITYYGTLVTNTVPLTVSYSTNMMQLTVNLRWTNRVAHLRSLSTFVARDGLQNYVY
jgi:Tfp pilus assembly protein PilV